MATGLSSAIIPAPEQNDASSLYVLAESTMQFESTSLYPQSSLGKRGKELNDISPIPS